MSLAVFYLMYKMSNDVIEWNKEKRKKKLGIFMVRRFGEKVSNIAVIKHKKKI